MVIIPSSGPYNHVEYLTVKTCSKRYQDTEYVENDKNYTVKRLKLPKIEKCFQKHCMVTYGLAKTLHGYNL